MFTQNARHLAAAVCLGCAVLVQGCATAPVATPEQAVTHRANQRWRHMLAGDWDKAYAMLTPAYRALHTRAEYQKNFSGAVAWRNAEVVAAACEADVCKLRVTITIATPLARRANDTITTTADETWLQDGGNWYHYEKP